ncbi:hypothetical protein THRCLA_20176 [Thraustotheca clavata]|uniref:Uncharacterized protein n=1 Tax=Thraustotheca clavata TaxID=74557 RepID=A0A1W0AAK8_9STRA|nr:hypothetical protein THRCLA_20176 [Thraustotheca clavata]
MLLSLFVRLSSSVGAGLIDAYGRDKIDNIEKSASLPANELAPQDEFVQNEKKKLEDAIAPQEELRPPQDEAETKIEQVAAAAATTTLQQENEITLLSADELIECRWVVDNLIELLFTASTFGMENREASSLVLQLEDMERNMVMDNVNEAHTWLVFFDEIVATLLTFTKEFKSAQMWYLLVECDTAVQQLHTSLDEPC